MKKFKSLLYVINAILLVGLASCGSDGPGSMNKGDAEAAFTSVNTDLAASLNELSTAPGAEALNSFANLTSTTSPFGRISSYNRKEVREQAKMSLSAVRSMLTHSAANAKVSGEEPFEYNLHKGVYEYNFETGLFDKTGESTIIKIFYPTEGSDTNDAEFRLSAYSEVLIGYEYEPTLIDATVLVDEEIAAELNLEASYNQTTEEPQFLDLAVSLTPFTWTVKLDDRPATTTSVSEGLSKNGTLLIGVGVTVTYNTADKSEENIKKISGYFQLMRIRFVASLEAATMQGPEDFKLGIKIDGKDAGDVVLVMDETTGDIVPYVKYNDGSTEPLGDVFGDLATELDGILNPGV